ncbi:hypothetical protein QTL95_07575 [Rhizobium sp. S152]|uniref:hypothetical protein n=1 Tax=Rhizobium sp. S152 TaxID=3055038 RepID=UPI0025A9D6EE|nr:hypothetical protein [Rhizobium sp. S152]MDM9625750.1 hypothetical protein [Rhizobium sp. S152]
MTTEDTFFNPAKLSPRDKAAATDASAKAIITAEATAREKKTEALKALRLQREAETPPQDAPAKKKRAGSKTTAPS